MADVTAITAIDITAKDSTQSTFDQVKGGLKGVGGAVDSLKGAFGGLLAGIGAGLFASAIKEAIDYADSLMDLSKQTGISVETLGGLGYAARQNGVELEDVAKGTQKLAQYMDDIAGGNEKAMGTFNALGISATNVDGSLRPLDETLFNVADRFAALPDGAEKAALAQEIFGKSGAALIPLLTEGGDKLREMVAEYQKYGGVSEETAAQADAFNDTLEKINLIQGSFMRSVAAALLPTLQSLLDIFLDLKVQGSDFGGVTTILVTAVKGLGIAAVGVVAAFKAVGQGLGALALAAEQVSRGEFRQAWNTLKEGGKDAADTISTAIDRAKTIWDASSTEIAKSTERSTERVKRASKEKENVLVKEWEALEKLRDKWLQVIDAQEGGLAPQTLKDFDELNKLLDSGQLSFDQYAKAIDVVLDKDPILKKEQDEINKALQETNDILAKGADAWAKEIKSLDDQVQKQRDANTAFGLGKSALVDLTIAQIDQKIAVERSGDAYSPYADHLVEVRDRMIELRDATALGEVLEVQKKQLDESVKNWERMQAAIAERSDQFVEDVIEDGWGTALRNLWSDFKRWAFAALAEVAAKKVLVPIVASVTSGAVAAGGLPGGGGGGGLSVDSLMSSPGISSIFTSFATSATGIALGLGETVATSSAAAIAGGLSLGVEAGATAATGALTTLGTTVMAAIPYIGAIAAVGALAYNYFSSQGGGPKSGGFAASGDTTGISGTDDSGRWFTPNSDDSKLQGFVDSLQTTFDGFVSSLGLTFNAAFALGYDSDPEGKAPNRLHAGVFGDAGQIYDQQMSDLGRDPAQLDAALKDAAKASLLAAFQAAGVPEAITDYLDSIPFDDFASALTDIAVAANTLDKIDTKKIFGELVDIDALAGLRQEGESFSQALARLAGVFVSTNAVAVALGKDAQTAFGEVGLASLTARENLIELAGGIDALTAQTNFYVENFYDDSRKLSMAQDSLGASMSDLQSEFPDLITSIPQTKAEFVKLVDSLDLSTEAGRQAYAALMRIAPTFDYVADASSAAQEQMAQDARAYADEMKRIADQLRSDAESLGSLQIQLGGGSDDDVTRFQRNASIDQFVIGRDWAKDTLQSGGYDSFAKLLSGITQEDFAAYSAADRQTILDILGAQNQLQSQGQQQSGGNIGNYGAPTSTAYDVPSGVVDSQQALADATLHLYDALARDPKAEAMQALAEKQVSQMDILQGLGARVADLSASYDGSAEKATALTKATNAYVDAQVALLIQIEQLKMSLDGMFQGSIDSIIWSQMSNDERRAKLMAEQADAMKELAGATDTNKIAELSKLINDDLVKAFNLLSPEEQKKQQDLYIGMLDDANKLSQQQLDLASAAVEDAEASAQTILTGLNDATQKQAEAAALFVKAAIANGGAADLFVKAAAAHEAAAAVIAQAAGTMKTATSTTPVAFVAGMPGP